MNTLEKEFNDIVKRRSVQRLYDLVRYARGYLFDAGLLTPAEYAALVQTGADSARRLESYDELRARVEKALADLAAERCVWQTTQDGGHVDSDEHRQWFGAEVVREWSHCPYCGRPITVAAPQGK